MAADGYRRVAELRQKREHRHRTKRRVVMFIFLTITSLFVVIRRSDLRTNERTNFVTYIYINEGQIQRLKVFSFLLFILGFQDLTFSPFFLQPTLRGEKEIRHFDRPLYLPKSFQKKTHTFLSSRHHGAIDRELRFRGLVPPDGSVGKVDEKDAVLSQGTRARLCRRFKDSFLFRVGTITPIIIRKTRNATAIGQSATSRPNFRQ